MASEKIEEKDSKKHGCKFNDFGCNFKGTERSAHERKEPVMHLSMLSDGTGDLRCDVHELVERVNDAERRVWDCPQVAHARMRQIGTSAYVWKIENWANVYGMAETGLRSVIFSPGFFTARHGYQLTASICPFGDGKVRGQFLSVFVSICRGPFDGLLAWPFSYKVKFVLMDQNEVEGERINHAMVLNPGKPKQDNVFLKRPTSERNPSFGLQRFIDLHLLTEGTYIADNTMYIKIELTDEETIVLRYE